jgi:DNA-binding transcriptional LysR family regulator
MNLDDLFDFVLVATHGGYAQASRKTGRAKASLSRKVMALEKSLGVRLFERSAKTSSDLKKSIQQSNYLEDRR